MDVPVTSHVVETVEQWDTRWFSEVEGLQRIAENTLPGRQVRIPIWSGRRRGIEELSLSVSPDDAGKVRINLPAGVCERGWVDLTSLDLTKLAGRAHDLMNGGAG